MSVGAASGGATRVRRRHVLFFGGFDPKGASWYHALYQRHAGPQATVNGMRIEVGPRRRDAAGNQHWIVRSDRDGADPCESCIEVVGWDAVVRQHWPRNATQVLGQLFGAYLAMLVHGPGELLKVGRIAPRTLVALAWPLLFLGAGLILCLALAGAVLFLAQQLGAPPALARVAAAVALGAGLWGVVRYERRLDTGLLGRIFAFVTRYAVRGIAELDEVIARGAQRIEAVLRAGDCDELLVVGYSVGSILATRSTARALAALNGASATTPALALLTLGNCIPLLGLFPQAADYRVELGRIAGSARLDWVDVSSPGDWGSFALLDPIEVCAVELGARGRGSPRMFSPRFHTLIEPERYRALIADKHAIHALYLMATDRPGVYDYFAITAGPEPLATRFPARAAGVSRRSSA